MPVPANRLIAVGIQPYGGSTFDAVGALSLVAELGTLSLVGLSTGYTVSVAGYTAKDDGGGGTFYLDLSSAATVDNGIVFATSGAGRWLRIFSGAINVRWFGARGNGVTDDTAAIQAAIDSAYYDIFIPAGNYIITRIDFGWIVDGVTSALIGKRVFGEGSTATILTAKTGITDDILIFIGNPNYAVDGKYVIRNVLENLMVNDDAMDNDPDYSGIVLYGTYDNRLSNLKLGYYANAFDRINLNISRGTYTTVITNVHGGQLQIASELQGDVTTITLIATSWVFVNLAKSVAINFIGLVVQGTVGVGYQLNRIQISNCYNVSFTDGDLEGDGVCFDIVDCTGIYILRNNVALAGQYAGPTNSIFIDATTSTKIISRDNIFMNWAPAGTYFVDGGGNTKMALMDFYGSFLCAIQYARTTVQNLTSGAFTICDFATSDFATEAGLVTTGAAWKFTAPVKGKYRVGASVIVSSVANDVILLAIFKNGVEVKRIGYPQVSTAGQVGMNINAIVDCAATDYIDIRVLSLNAAPTLVAAATGQFVTVELIPYSG